MKRPVTSLCRRPGKKDRLRGSLSPMREQFPPTGTLCGGQAELPGKSRPNEGLKTAPGGGRELCAGCAHGGMVGNGGVWFWEGTALGTRWDRGHARAQNSPRRGPGAVRRLRPWGKGGNGRCLVPGRRRTGHPPGQRACPGAKTASGRAGGCLDAGYGCYLPRAIRVIWMHRVGSTARPRIMPS